MTDLTHQQFSVTWHDHHRAPQCQPDPAFPSGKAVNTAIGAQVCTVQFPYPARRCGVYVAECRICGYKIGVTTAGRPDDPVSATFDCGMQGETVQ